MFPVGIHPFFVRQNEQLQMSLHTGHSHSGFSHLQHVFPVPHVYAIAAKLPHASTYTCYTSCACPAFSVDTGGNTPPWWRHTIAGLGCRSRTRTVPIPSVDRLEFRHVLLGVDLFVIHRFPEIIFYGINIVSDGVNVRCFFTAHARRRPSFGRRDFRAFFDSLLDKCDADDEALFVFFATFATIASTFVFAASMPIDSICSMLWRTRKSRAASYALTTTFFVELVVSSSMMWFCWKAVVESGLKSAVFCGDTTDFWKRLFFDDF